MDDFERIDTNLDYSEADLLERLTNLTADVSLTKSTLTEAEKENNAHLERMSKLREEYLAELSKMEKEREDISALVNAKKREEREKRRELERVQRMLDQKRALSAMSDRLQGVATTIDVLTASHVWREWAHEYQLEAARRITFAQGFLLADEMGLGKTLTAFMAMDMIRAHTEKASVIEPIENPFQLGLTQNNEVIKPCGKKILYLCPKMLINNVVREGRRFSPTRTYLAVTDVVAQKAARDMIFNMVVPAADEITVVMNYEIWRRDISVIDKLIRCGFDMIICDEFHVAKDTKSLTFGRIKQIAEGQLNDPLFPGEQGQRIPYRLMMTGTPILNRPDDIFAALNLINPSRFANKYWFLQDYCQQRYVYNARVGKHRQVWTFAGGGEKRLIQQIRNIVLKRKKADVGIELPPLTIEDHLLAADEDAYPNQWRVYNEMRQYGIAMIEKGNYDKGYVQSSVVIAMLTRLRQMLLWPAGIQIFDPITKEIQFTFDIQESQKLDYVFKAGADAEAIGEGLIAEIARHQNNPEGERTVVFSQFIGPLKALEERLTAAGYRVGVLIGATSDTIREQISKDCDVNYVTEHTDNEGNSRVGYYDIILANYKVGGVGLNLNDFTQAIVLDSEWSPGKRDQAYGRIWRLGQAKPTTIHRVLVEKTVDDWLEWVMETKQDMLEGFEGNLNLAEMLRFAIEEGNV